MKNTPHVPGPKAPVMILAAVVLFAACASPVATPDDATPAVAAPPDVTVLVELEPETGGGPGEPVSTTPDTFVGDTPTDDGAGESNGPGTRRAFDELRADEGGRIVRWQTTDVTVTTVGDPTVVDLATLSGLARELSGIPGVPRLVTTRDTNADIVVHFLPKRLWRSVLPDAKIDDAIDGQARYVQVDGTITEASVIVDAESSQTQRNRTIVHEILHAYGLGHHSCPGGILFGGAEYDPAWRLGEYDQVLLAAWYATHRGEPDLDVDIPCPVVRWDTVTFDGTLLWCATDDDECYPVDERVGAVTDAGPAGWRRNGAISVYDPDLYTAFTNEDVPVLCRVGEGIQPCETGAQREVVNPDRWYDGQFLYDHDPGTHVVFVLDGRRLLCRIPSGTRAPCQYTDGVELTATDLYTDGESVYDTP